MKLAIFQYWLVWLTTFRKFELELAHFSARLARASSAQLTILRFFASSAQLSSPNYTLASARLSSAHKIRENFSSAQLELEKIPARSTSITERLRGG